MRSRTIIDSRIFKAFTLLLRGIRSLFWTLSFFQRLSINYATHGAEIRKLLAKQKLSQQKT